MILERPDLTGLDLAVIAYIEALEAELDDLRNREEENSPSRAESTMEPSEPPTTINVISISKQGYAKRTPRHFYFRQRRGGMGVFDLDSAEGDLPAFLLTADESAGLILVTNHARAFRTALGNVPETPVRGRGQSLLSNVPLREGEKLSLVFPDQGGQFLALVSERGQIRKFGSQQLGARLQPGTVLYDTREGGAPAAFCWSSGSDEIFIATRLGKAIRFAERQIPVRGCLGMRVDPEDRVVGVAAAPAEGGILMMTGDGKGTVRLLSGFTANKEPGSGGKVAMKTEELIGVMAITDQSDAFVISRLGKIVRFAVNEIPAKEGVVQGVNCMALRADECVAVTACEVK
ncbi:MAG: DNA gyrase C-terminal beta-propeller domain-containing protein [Caldilineaceae bacterium]